MTEPNIDIVIDCHVLEAQLDFWAGALGYRKVGIRHNYGLLLPREPPTHRSSSSKCQNRRPRRRVCTSTSASRTSKSRPRSSRRLARVASMSVSQPKPTSSRWPTPRGTSSACAPVHHSTAEADLHHRPSPHRSSLRCSCLRMVTRSGSSYPEDRSRPEGDNARQLHPSALSPAIETAHTWDVLRRLCREGPDRLREVPVEATRCAQKPA